jgi:hypothetical protein
LTHFCEAAPELQAPQYYLNTKIYLARVFEKQKSIFLEWTDDDITHQKLIQESDFKYWGVAKIIKNDTDVSIPALTLLAAPVHQESTVEAHGSLD